MFDGGTIPSRFRCRARYAAACLVALAILAKAPAGLAQLSVRVCPLEAPAQDCDRRGLAEALQEAEDGATIILRPGIYGEAAVLRADRVTLRGEPGAHLRGVAAQGKAALVIAGDDVVIEGLECSDIRVPDGNGACVRAEGRNLTLRRVHFHDSQEGVLGGNGLLVIEDSLFERLGGDRATGVGRAHGVYASGRVERLVLRRNRFLASREEGHEIKSRARETLIENNVIASLDGVDSRLIDVPNGGEVIVRGNVLEIGANSSNPDLIGLGLERGRHPAGDHQVNSVLIEGNTIYFDHGKPARLIHAKDYPPPIFRDNVLIGGPPPVDSANLWFADRAAAGLPPYPALEHWARTAPEPAVSEEKTSDLSLDFERHSARWKGREVPVSEAEFALLTLLSAEPGRVLTYGEILDGLEAAGVPSSSGAAVTERRDRVLALMLSLRKAFREGDPGFSALVYEPSQGLGWRERR